MALGTAPTPNFLELIYIEIMTSKFRLDQFTTIRQGTTIITSLPLRLICHFLDKQLRQNCQNIHHETIKSMRSCWACSVLLLIILINFVRRKESPSTTKLNGGNYKIKEKII